MSLYHRIRRRLGYDTEVQMTHEHPKYRYEVEHIDGETTTVNGHGYNVDGSIIRVYEYTDIGVYPGTLPASTYLTGQEINAELGSINRIDSTEITVDAFRVVVDKADNTMIEKGLI